MSDTCSWHVKRDDLGMVKKTLKFAPLSLYIID